MGFGVEAKLQALWTLEVDTPVGWLPAGVIIFHLRRVFGDFYEEGRIFGGDQSQVFTGAYTIENLQLRGHLEVKRYALTGSEPFGPGVLVTVELAANLDGQADRDVIDIRGQIGGSPSTRLRLTRRATLA